VFNNLGWGESAFLLLLALLIFGPERLPKMAAQAGRAVRQFRSMASGVTDDLKRELGDSGLDFREELRQLDPKRMLMDDGPAPTPARARLPERLAAGQAAPFDPDAT
jgi:sec-independent protein translocase protein TatB